MWYMSVGEGRVVGGRGGDVASSQERYVRRKGSFRQLSKYEPCKGEDYQDQRNEKSTREV